MEIEGGEKSKKAQPNKKGNRGNEAWRGLKKISTHVNPDRILFSEIDVGETHGDGPDHAKIYYDYVTNEEPMPDDTYFEAWLLGLIYEDGEPTRLGYRVARNIGTAMQLVSLFRGLASEEIGF